MNFEELTNQLRAVNTKSIRVNIYLYENKLGIRLSELLSFTLMDKHDWLQFTIDSLGAWENGVVVTRQHNDVVIDEESFNKTYDLDQMIGDWVDKNIFVKNNKYYKSENNIYYLISELSQFRVTFELEEIKV